MGETKGTKYTPGPWHVAHVWANDDDVIYSGSLPIARVMRTRQCAELKRQLKEWPENAKLIASAPDMDRKLTSALVSIRERMGLYEKDYGFTESMNLDDYDQAAQGPQWNRAYGNYESLMEMREILEGKV